MGQGLKTRHEGPTKKCALLMLDAGARCYSVLCVCVRIGQSARARWKSVPNSGASNIPLLEILLDPKQ
jgi:hypothetical protein